jgi:hypothetical protein
VVQIELLEHRFEITAIDSPHTPCRRWSC